VLGQYPEKGQDFFLQKFKKPTTHNDWTISEHKKLSAAGIKNLY